MKQTRRGPKCKPPHLVKVKGGWAMAQWLSDKVKAEAKRRGTSQTEVIEGSLMRDNGWSAPE